MAGIRPRTQAPPVNTCAAIRIANTKFIWLEAWDGFVFVIVAAIRHKVGLGWHTSFHFVWVATIGAKILSLGWHALRFIVIHTRLTGSGSFPTLAQYTQRKEQKRSKHHSTMWHGVTSFPGLDPAG